MGKTWPRIGSRFGQLAWLLIGVSLPVLAQSNLRNSFPGSRMGGGTRGECSARLVAHLVPENSVYAPGSSGLIGILEGPTAQPRPLQIVVKPAGTAGGNALQRDLAATGAGVTLLNIGSVKTAQIWETGYRCEQSQASGAGLGLDFVETASPPAKSLLVTDVQPADQQIAAALQALKTSCGKTVASTTVAKAFGMNDAITPDWPQQLPVRCP